jgi:RecA-family ATPase
MNSNPVIQGLTASEKPNTALERLRSLSTVPRIDEMKNNLENEFYVFEGMALDGQITLFYAKPNTGKTLIFLKLLIDGINKGKIRPEDIFYINADDNYRGLCHKSEIAKEYGFVMISPAEAGIAPAEIITLLDELSKTDDAKGKIIVLDTLKKFTDMMNKKSQADLYNVLRKLVAKNATVIIAGHANKHLNAEGNLVYEGTSDTMNDIDCAYAIYLMTEPDGDVVVEFRREKSRGDNIAKVAYGYTRVEGMSYMDLVNSVYKLDSEQAEKATLLGHQQRLSERYDSEIIFITNLLKSGRLNQSQILAKLKELEGDGIASEVSVRSLKAALTALINIKWKVSRDKNNNANIYTLISEMTAYYEDVKNGSN